MNTTVTFPIAKLLKEKEFDAYCDKKYIAQCLWQKPNSREKYKNSEIHKNSGDISAPTIAEVVMWLYEKHKIWISVGGDCDYKFKFEIHTWKWYEPEKSYRLGHTVLGETFWDCRSKEFSSPTEAYEAAIEYTLNNLI